MMLSREKYFRELNKAFAENKISEDAFWQGVENAEIFCEYNDDEYEREDD